MPAFYRAIMLRFIAAAGLLSIAIAANAALYFHERAEPRAPTGMVSVQLGEMRLSLPRALIREPSQASGGRLARLDLAMSIADFAALPPPSPRRLDPPSPDRLTLVLTAAANGNGPSEQFQQLYARFLARETWTNPGGLIMRRFRAGTPYEDREIYIGAGTGRLFIALCPREESVRAIEPCIAQLRDGTADVELRFEARHLPEWRRLVGETLGRLADWRGGN